MMGYTSKIKTKNNCPSPIQANVAERVIRTVKAKLWHSITAFVFLWRHSSISSPDLFQGTKILRQGILLFPEWRCYVNKYFLGASSFRIKVRIMVKWIHFAPQSGFGWGYANQRFCYRGCWASVHWPMQRRAFSHSISPYKYVICQMN